MRMNIGNWARCTSEVSKQNKHFIHFYLYYMYNICLLEHAPIKACCARVDTVDIPTTTAAAAAHGFSRDVG